MCANENIVVGGDFNCALKELDKKGGNPVSKKTSVIKEIEQLCNTHKLIDIWRFLNPGVESFTWRNKSFKIQCRLDYFLISKGMHDLVTSCKITHAPQTDHSAVRNGQCSSPQSICCGVPPEIHFGPLVFLALY